MNLTPKQLQTLNVIADFWNKNQFAPSIADIRIALNLGKNSNGTVIFRINSLKAKKLISRIPKVARTLKLTKDGKKILSENLFKQLEVETTSTLQNKFPISNLNYNTPEGTNGNKS